MSIKIKKVQVIIENEFATTDKNDKNLDITVFERVFRKLTMEKSGIGKIFPIYIKLDGIIRVLGIITLNQQGSTSVFLELPNGAFFDHITLGKHLNKNCSHLTHLKKGMRKKVSSLNTTLLSNGVYHVITLIIEDFKLLKLSPKEIVYPEVSAEQSKLLKDALITREGFNGSGLLEPPGEKGPVIIQLFLIPEGIDFKNLQFTPITISDPLLKHFQDIEKLKILKKHISCLKHEFQTEYQIGLLTFRHPAKINAPIYLGYSIDKSKFFFNSLDKELNASVIKHVQKKLKR